MTAVPPDRVRVATATTGTGTSLALGAVPSPFYLSPSEAAMIDGRYYHYVLEQGTDWEENAGVYNATAGTIGRTSDIMTSKINGVVSTVNKLNLDGTAFIYFPPLPITDMDRGPTCDCILRAESASLLRLSRYNGFSMLINDKREVIPVAGVTMNAAGLITSATYYVYCYMNGPTMTLARTTVAPVTDPVMGIKVDSGDRSRTFVGAFQEFYGGGFGWSDPNGSKQVAEEYDRALVRSWYNDEGAFQVGFLTVTAPTWASVANGDMGGSMHCEFLAWQGEEISFGLMGLLWNNGDAAANHSGFFEVFIRLMNVGGTQEVSIVPGTYTGWNAPPASAPNISSSGIWGSRRMDNPGGALAYYYYSAAMISTGAGVTIGGNGQSWGYGSGNANMVYIPARRNR